MDEVIGTHSHYSPDGCHYDNCHNKEYERIPKLTHLKLRLYAHYFEVSCRESPRAAVGAS
jgi:hypothetical protein